VAAYRSSRGDGIRFATGVFAATIALLECVSIIVLVNRPALLALLATPEWVAPWLTAVAVVVMVLIAGCVIVGATPRYATR